MSTRPATTIFLLAGAALMAVLAACAHSHDDDVLPYVPSSFDNDAAAEDAGCALQCSLDFTQVIRSCDGTVVETCPPEQACGATGCISPCEAVANAQSSLGCDYLAQPPGTTVAAGSCYAAYVVNAWHTAMTLGVSLGDEALDISKAVYRFKPGSADLEPLTGPIQPNDAVIVFLSDAPNTFTPEGYTSCPAGAIPATTKWTSPAQTGRGTSFRIDERPLERLDNLSVRRCQELLPDRDSAPARRLLEHPAHHRRAVAEVGGNFDRRLADGADRRCGGRHDRLDTAREGDPVGRQRDRRSRRPGRELHAQEGGVPPALPERGALREPRRVDQADRHVRRAWLHDDSCRDRRLRRRAEADSGFRAVGPRVCGGAYRGRIADSESTPYRIVAGVDGTQLTYEPAPPVGAPATLAAGQVATFWTKTPFIVKSQDPEHPVYVAAYMTGGGNPGLNAAGDPESVNLVPVGQYLK